MLKCITGFLLIIILLVPITAVNADTFNIDKSELNNGLVIIASGPSKDVPTKIMISKGYDNYVYALYHNSRIPL